MKSPGPANTDPSSTAGYPAALYNTVSGGGEGLWDQHPHYTMECTVDEHGAPKATGMQCTPVL